MKENRVVALLPMKANSERVPGKNFKPLEGKPLFKWMLDSLLEVDVIDKVVINTDAKEILLKNGLVETERVLIRERKSELCGDFVSMNKILADDIEAVDANLYLMTHTTNPMLSSKTIKSAIDVLHANGKTHDSLFTVNKHQTRFYREDCSPVNHDPNVLMRTQDLEAWYEENSCLYLFTKESFAKTNARIGEKPYMFATPKIESVDIDTPEDWQIAEALAKSLGKHVL